MVAFVGAILIRIHIYCVCSEYLSRVSAFFLHNKQIALLGWGHYSHLMIIFTAVSFGHILF